MPTLDTVSMVGDSVIGIAGDQKTCAHDPEKKLLVRTQDATSPFLFWDLQTAGPSNPDKRVDISASIVIS